MATEWTCGKCRDHIAGQDDRSARAAERLERALNRMNVRRWSAAQAYVVEAICILNEETP